MNELGGIENLKYVFIFIVLLSLTTLQNIPYANYHISSDDYVWYDDCSDTSGFTRVDEWKSFTPMSYGEMYSDGNYLLFNNIVDINGPRGPTFIHEFDDPFQLCTLEEFYMTLYASTDDVRQRGQIYIYLMDEMYSPVLLVSFSDASNSTMDAEVYYSFYPLHSDYVGTSGVHSGNPVSRTIFTKITFKIIQ